MQPPNETRHWLQSRFPGTAAVAPPRTRSSWELFRIALTIVRQAPLLFVVLPSVIPIGLMLLVMLVSGAMVAEENKLIRLGGDLAFYVGWTWARGAQLYWIEQQTKGRSIRTAEAINMGFGFMGSLFWIDVELFVRTLPCLAVLALPFLIPSMRGLISSANEGLLVTFCLLSLFFLTIIFYVFVTFCLAAPIAVFTGKSSSSACSDSRFYTIGARRSLAARISAYFALWGTVLVIPIFLCGALVLLLTSDALVPLLVCTIILLGLLIQGIFLSIITILICLLYVERLALCEGWSCRAPIGFDNSPMQASALRDRPVVTSDILSKLPTSLS